MSEADELRAALAHADKVIEKLTDQREEMAQRIDALTAEVNELRVLVAQSPPEQMLQTIVGWMREE